MPQRAAHVCGTGESDLVYIGVGHDHRPRTAAAGDHVDYTLRQSGFRYDFCKQERTQARIGCWFKDYCITHRDGWRDLPGQHQQREVPRNDLPHHTNRLVITQFGFHQLGPAGIIIKVTRQQRHIDITRFTDGFTVVHRLEHRQQTVVLLNIPRDRI